MLRSGGIGLIAISLCACQATELRPGQADATLISDGKLAAERLGCGTCHDLPGVKWPRGQVGPALEGFGDRAMIAGRLPNRPETLARFVRDAPSLIPATAMPAIPMTDEEATAIAAWLQSLNAS